MSRTGRTTRRGREALARIGERELATRASSRAVFTVRAATVARVHAGLVVAALFVAVLPTRAAAQIEFCGPSDRTCARMTVPLDRSGALPGNVTLTIERMRATKAQDPPLFLLAGGPGQSGTRAFPQLALDQLLGGVLARRDVVVFDQRGTGGSGALSCPALQAAGSTVGAAVAQCATALGPGRAFYTTADSVADLDALRAGLGYDRIALFAGSYGTKVALDYAASHPDRVERLVLDSPVGPSGVDPLYRASFAATPRVLRDLCRGRCRGITADPVRDLTKLINMLARQPLRGTTLTPEGRSRRASLTRFELFATIAAGDDRPGVRERFPAAAHSAVTGDPAPILRLKQFAEIDEGAGPQVFSAGTFAATICEDTALPWDASVPVDGRLDHAARLLAAESPNAFAPFDAETALGSNVLRLCEHWPTSGRATAGTGPLPNIPVLVLSGSQDLRTPTEGALRVAELFPQARSLIAPGLGHDVTGAASGCPSAAVRNFLTGRHVPTRCPRARLAPTQRDPRSLRALRPAPGTRGRRGRTLTAVRRTYQDALHSFFDLYIDRILADPLGLSTFRFAAGGLRSGRYAFTPERARLREPGLRTGSACQWTPVEHLDSARRSASRSRPGGGTRHPARAQRGHVRTARGSTRPRQARPRPPRFEHRRDPLAVRHQHARAP